MYQNKQNNSSYGSLISIPLYVIFYQYITNSYLFSKQYEILPQDGYIDAGYQILKYKGFFSFWRGITFYFWYILICSITSVLCFRFPDQIRNLIKDIVSYPFLFAFIAYVIDPAQTFTGFFAQFYLLWEKGIFGVFTGMCCYLIATHTIPLGGFVLSNIMPKQIGIALKILFAVPFSLLLYPFIYVQCRMIAAVCYGKSYEGMINCFSEIIDKQGWTVLFTGSIFHVIAAIVITIILNIGLLAAIKTARD